MCYTNKMKFGTENAGKMMCRKLTGTQYNKRRSQRRILGELSSTGHWEISMNLLVLQTEPSFKNTTRTHKLLHQLKKRTVRHDHIIEIKKKTIYTL